MKFGELLPKIVFEMTLQIDPWISQKKPEPPTGTQTKPVEFVLDFYSRGGVHLEGGF